jgi:excisionase family DNA binding protein
MMDELLGVETVADYLGVRPATIYRWCREGSLACVKLGKTWRIRRTALEAFLAHRERPQTLVDHLRSFVTVPDELAIIADDETLLTRVDAALLTLGARQGGVLVKYTSGETRSLPELRQGLRAHGLAVERLEAEGRFHWDAASASPAARVGLIRQVLAEAAGRSVWVSLDWTTRVELATMQQALRVLVNLGSGSALVVKTAVLASIVETWSAAEQQHLPRTHSGLIRIAPEELVLSRRVPLPTA